MEEKRVPRTWRPGDIVPNVLREGAAASRGKSLPSTQQLERATGVRRRFESIDRTVNQSINITSSIQNTMMIDRHG